MEKTGSTPPLPTTTKLIKIRQFFQERKKEEKGAEVIQSAFQ